MLGPEKSAPYIQALNAFVGVGFMFGSLIIRPFLPEQTEDSTVCGSKKGQMLTNVSFAVDANEVESTPSDELLGTVPALVWPFLIIAMVHILTGLAFIIIGLFSFKQKSSNNCFLKFSND